MLEPCTDPSPAFPHKSLIIIRGRMIACTDLPVSRIGAGRVNFRLPPSRPKRTPSEIAYGADDRPPLGLTLSLGAQHAVMAIALSTYALVVAKLANLSLDDAQSLLTCTILGMALATFLQSWGGRLGAGAFIAHIPDPISVPFVAIIIARYGPGGVLPAAVAAGFAALVVSRIIPHLRPLFPPTVMGVVVTVGGFSLVRGALEHSLGLDGAYLIDPRSLLISLVTLGIIVGFSIWGTRAMQLFSLLAGLVVGIVVSAALGYLHGLERFATTPVFALPHVPTPVFGIDPGMLAAVVMVALLVQLDTFASVVIMDKMDDADWRRSDMRMVSGGIQAGGLANLLTGLIGALPTATSSANIGLCHATRATSRYIGVAAALMIAVAALLPQVTLALTLIPTPVIGAIEIYAAGFFAVSGLELAASRQLDSRGIFMIGISLTVGLGVMLMPQLVDNVPEVMKHMVGSGFVMAGITAVLLNLLFRLGTSMRARRELGKEGQATSEAIVDFIETQGGLWAARRDVVRRAALAALEAAEFVDASGEGRHATAIQARFDEFNLDVELIHTGPPLVLAGPQAPVPDLHALLDADEDAIDAAMAGVSSVLVQRLADRVRSGTRDGASYLLLHFDH